MAEYKDLLKYDYEKPEFPIDPMKPLIEEIMSKFSIQHDDNVMKAVADVGIVVDKPRLMQALTDAKAFYEEGYRAAMNRADVVEVVRCCECQYWESRNSINSQGICRCGNMEMNYCGEFYPMWNDFCSYGVKNGEKSLLYADMEEIIDATD